MKENKKTIDRMICSVNNGEVLRDLKPGDRIYIKTHEKIEKEKSLVEVDNTKPFTKLFDSAIKEIIKLDLSQAEYKVMLFLITNVRYESGLVSYSNGKTISIKDILEETNLSKQTIINVLNKLCLEKIIAKVKCGRENQILMNPYITCKGQYINKTLEKIFYKSSWNKVPKE